MPPSLPTQPPPPENKFPDCLFLKLEGIPVQLENENHPDFWEASSETQFFDLYVTLKFNEQWESLSNGRVKFGIKGGELRLNLKNAEIIPESCSLITSLELSLPEEKQAVKERKDRQVRARAGNISLNGSKTEAITVFELKKKFGITSQSPVPICHVTKKLSDSTVVAQLDVNENHVWVFEEEKNELVLKGLLNKVKLATLNVTAFPCSIQATFTVSQRDVCLSEVEGLWSPDISRNKKAVLNRLIIQRLLEPKLKPYLSRGSLDYD